jgi:hypothetical protein
VATPLNKTLITNIPYWQEQAVILPSSYGGRGDTEIEREWLARKDLIMKDVGIQYI